MGIEVEQRLQRIRWRGRRGLLELDIVLTRFFDERLDQLSDAEIAQLEEVLQLPDNDFLDMVMGRAECRDPRIRPMIEMIRTC